VARSAREAVRRNKKSLLLPLAGGKPPAITSAIVYDAAVRGDRTAREVLAETGRILAEVIGSLINVLNPAMVVLTGGLSRAGRLLFGPLREEVPKHCFAVSLKGTRIVPGKLGDNAGLAGAALFAFQNMENR